MIILCLFLHNILLNYILNLSLGGIFCFVFNFPDHKYSEEVKK